MTVVADVVLGLGKVDGSYDPRNEGLLPAGSMRLGAIVTGAEVLL